jgi:sulfite reductase (ferredoxin)
MKYLFLTQGWTADRFLSELNSRLGFTLDPAVAEEHAPIEHFRDHVGIHPQRQPGLSYAGFSVAAGRLRPSLLRRIADWAEEYGDGTLRTTIAQNLVVLNVPDARVASFEQAVGSGGIAPVASPFQRGIVACTGSEFCKLALVETKAFSLNLIPDLERRLPNFSQHLRIHVTGCPNACGQHWIADIGLQGVQVEDAGQQVDGFELFVGGGLGRDADFAHRVGVRLPATRVASALETLLRAYLATREEGDVFRTWTARVTDARLKELLAA